MSKDQKAYTQRVFGMSLQLNHCLGGELKRTSTFLLKVYKVNIRNGICHV